MVGNLKISVVNEGSDQPVQRPHRSPESAFELSAPSRCSVTEQIRSWPGVSGLYLRPMRPDLSFWLRR